MNPAPTPELGQRWHGGLTARVRRWLEAREQRLTVERCGGDQRCPWCRGWVNHFSATSMRPSCDGFTDIITCGNCGGTSLWKWEIGFFYVGRLEPPPPVPSSYVGDTSWIEGVLERARGGQQ